MGLIWDTLSFNHVLQPCSLLKGQQKGASSMSRLFPVVSYKHTITKASLLQPHRVPLIAKEQQYICLHNPIYHIVMLEHIVSLRESWSNDFKNWYGHQ